MLTGRQLRQARALLNWRNEDLASRAGLPLGVVQRAEADDGEANVTMAHAIVLKHALARAGIEFHTDDRDIQSVHLSKTTED